MSAAATLRAATGRGLAGLLGGLLLLDALRAAVGWGADWWLDLRNLAPAIAQPARLIVGGLLLAHALAPATGRGRRVLTRSAALVVCAVALRDAAGWRRLVDSGALDSGASIPLSWVLCLGAAFVAWQAGARAGRPRPGEHLTAAGVLAIGAAGLALAQMWCFGATDYRRRADAVVVLGARTYADGRPSLALADRVRTASGLVVEGYASTLVLSGGPGDGGTHETEAMRELALSCGVPESAIRLDRQGLSTRHTARNARRLLGERARVLAVSHGYHLPRVRLALLEEGIEAFTVPAEETRELRRLPYYMAREVAAFWLYYLAPPRDRGAVSARRARA